MHSNYKVKLAVAAAVSLIALSLQENALALGLSDISVKSHLGQPFKAKINVLGAGEIKDASCLKLVSSDEISNQLRNAHLRLSPINGDEATLTITTSQIINEPILNLSIAAECDGVIRRDYVVLVDPILTAESSDVSDEEVVMSDELPVVPAKKDPVKHQPHYSQTIVTGENQAPQHKKASKQKTSDSHSNSANVVLHVPGRSADNTSTSAGKGSLGANQARLSISGGQSDAALNTASLRLDRQLTFTPDANAPAVVADVEIQDEVTALNNRLANLGKQISKLQQENLSLKSENTLKAQQLSQANSLQSKLSSLLPILGGGLLLVGGYFAASWWRRRQVKLQEENTDALWADINNDLDAERKTLAATTTATEENIFADIEPKTVTEIKPVDKSTSMEMSFEATKATENPILVEEDNTGLSVLDHADVFLSHGRTNLAIQLLQNHLLDYPKQSVTIWLFLLDLLAKENMKDVYEKTALECKEHFNIKISEFALGDKNSFESLESFPHLCEGLQQTWNNAGCVVYLDDLIYNTRLEPRAGFDKNLIEELMLLKGIAQQNVDSAEIIQLDEKKLAIKEQKEAVLAAKKAEKMQQMKEAMLAEQAKASTAESTEKLYEFGLVEWK